MSIQMSQVSAMSKNLCDLQSEIIAQKELPSFVGKMRAHLVGRLVTLCVALILHAEAVMRIALCSLAWIAKVFGGVNPELIAALRVQSAMAMNLSIQAIGCIVTAGALNDVFAKAIVPQIGERSPEPQESATGETNSTEGVTSQTSDTQVSAALFTKLTTAQTKLQTTQDLLATTLLNALPSCQIPAQQMKHAHKPHEIFDAAACAYHDEDASPVRCLIEWAAPPRAPQDEDEKSVDISHGLFAIFEPESNSQAPFHLAKKWKEIASQLGSWHHLTDEQIKTSLKEAFTSLHEDFKKLYPNDPGCSLSFAFLLNHPGRETTLFLISLGKTKAFLDSTATFVDLNSPSTSSLRFGHPFSEKELDCRQTPLHSESHLILGSSHLFDHLSMESLVHPLFERNMVPISTTLNNLVSNLANTARPPSLAVVAVQLRHNPKEYEDRSPLESPTPSPGVPSSFRLPPLSPPRLTLTTGPQEPSPGNDSRSSSPWVQVSEGGGTPRN